MSDGNADFDAELRALLAAGQKIEAIKRYRQETGAGLAEAKEVVEALQRGEPLALPEPLDPSLEAELVALLEQGRKIEAIKVYRERLGAGLKEAKEAVEAIATRHHVVAPTGPGCFGVLLLLAFVVAGMTVIAAAEEAPPQHDEEALKQRYDAFVESLDHRKLAEDYPGAVRHLDSADPRKQIVGIKTLAATEQVQAIPLIVPLLDSEDRHVRIYAGQALNALVATHQLKRRDKSQSERVVILPPGPGDIDLKPMSWVILKMLRKPDDGNTHAFAANMIGYGGFDEYGPELCKLLDSRHPAVTTAARRALEMIGASEQDGEEASLDDLVSQLQKHGLHITADQKKIGAATSEAAYFMFADRKEHRPKCQPFSLPEKGEWLDGKPVFGPQADKDKIYPLFNRLVNMVGYNEVCIYDADVHYGVSSHANFTLYKLGYVKDDERRGKKPEVLLGDAEYVINLP
jgi:ribosomal protein L7/L12